MTDKQLKKLRRRELLELMFEMRKKLDELTRENEQLKAASAADGGMSDSQLLKITAERVERLYADRFGEDAPQKGASDVKPQGGDEA